MWEIYRELVLLLAEPVEFSRQLWEDMHEVRAGLLDGEGRPLERVSDRTVKSLKFCATRIARDLGRRLPDVVHNMLLLGERDERVRKYVVMCERSCTKKGS